MWRSKGTESEILSREKRWIDERLFYHSMSEKKTQGDLAVLLLCRHTWTLSTPARAPTKTGQQSVEPHAMPIPNTSCGKQGSRIYKKILQ